MARTAPDRLPAVQVGVLFRMIERAWRAATEPWAAAVALDAGVPPEAAGVFVPRSPARSDVLAELADVVGVARSTAAKYASALEALGVLRRFGRALVLDADALDALADGGAVGEAGDDQPDDERIDRGSADVELRHDVEIEHQDVELRHPNVELRHRTHNIPPRTIRIRSGSDPQGESERARGRASVFIPEDVRPLVEAAERAHRIPGPISDTAKKRLTKMADDTRAARALLGDEWTRAAWIARLLAEVDNVADASLPVPALAARIERLVETASARRGQASARPGDRAGGGRGGGVGYKTASTWERPQPAAGEPERMEVDEDAEAAAVWAPVRAAVAARVTEANFATYFEPLIAVGIERGRLLMTAPDPFLAMWVDVHYRDVLREAAAGAGLSISVVEPYEAGATAERPMAAAGGAR